ncbi:MAG: hypothetical protein HY399_04745 [Elusimicrobia bacterium]|nr:hypothetical protein [Elusimicrobiota bacterium]
MSISETLGEAGIHYQDRRWSEALTLFERALDEAPDASSREDEQKKIDCSDVGFACWAIYVCYDAISDEKRYQEGRGPVDLLEDAEFVAILEAIKLKSPVTAYRIMERLAEVRVKVVKERRRLDLEREILHIAQSEKVDNKKLVAPLTEFRSLCDQDNMWWRLRDLGKQLLKTLVKRDFIWGLYNHIIGVSLRKGGNSLGMYECMGDLRKKEGSFYDAARLFLMAYCDALAPTKRSKEQFRICLKKAGITAHADKILSSLVTIAKSEGIDFALRRLDEVREKVNDEGKGK